MQTPTYSYLVWQVEELSKRSEMGGEFFSESWKPAPSTISAMMIPTEYNHIGYTGIKKLDSIFRWAMVRMLFRREKNPGFFWNGNYLLYAKVPY